MNNEAEAGQIIFHAHIHIIPRFENDGGYFGRHIKYEPGEAENLAEKIRKNLK